jgi:hypothetical protein
LQIQRVDFTHLFHRVILNPIDATIFGSFAIESGGTVSTTNSVTTTKWLTNCWYLQGTAVRLYDTNNVSQTMNMETKAVIQSDTSYVFENGAWRGQLSGYGTNEPLASYNPSAASAFTSLANSLGTTRWDTNINTLYNAAPTTAVLMGDFYSFMMDYNLWASEGYPTMNNPGSNGIPHAGSMGLSYLLNGIIIRGTFDTPPTTGSSGLTWWIIQ